LRDAPRQRRFNVFRPHLKDLLLAAPAGPRATMGLDPGMQYRRESCRWSDATGKVVDTAVIYPLAKRLDGCCKALSNCRKT